jgi:antirestriction protein ArdC
MPWHQPWHTQNLGALRPLRHGGEPYRGINILSLWMAATTFGYASPYWMTYRQACELGGQVRKGEKGAPVVFAGSLIKTDTDAPEEAEAREIHYMKGYTVFNAAQIDGLPERFTLAPSQPRLDPPQRDSQAEAFFAATGAEVRHGGACAYYAPKLDRIQLPPIESFIDNMGYYATRAHETVHWTSYEKRLNRGFEGNHRFGGEAYAVEELVAELGAAFLSVDLQLTPELRPDHASYIQNWLKVLKNDNRAIFTAAAHAQRACDYLNGLQPVASP